MKLELRAMTNSQRMRDKAVMMSSTTPSAKYSCSGSPLRFRNGKAAMEGLSGRVSAGADGLIPIWRVRASGTEPIRADASLTSPTKRNPLRAMVRIKRCSSPLSPIALRTALIWLVKVDSETIRPPQTASSKSSLLTTCSRFWTR